MSIDAVRLASQRDAGALWNNITEQLGLSMIQAATFKAIVDYSGRAWGAIGPLVGVLIGAYLSTRTERRHWLRDNERLEYRQLFTTLIRSYSTIVNIKSRSLRTGEDELQAEQARLESLNVVRDRIFIAPEIRQMQILDTWSTALDHFQAQRDYKAFAAEFAGIMDRLRRSAERLIR